MNFGASLGRDLLDRAQKYATVIYGIWKVPTGVRFPKELPK